MPDAYNAQPPGSKEQGFRGHVTHSMIVGHRPGDLAARRPPPANNDYREGSIGKEDLLRVIELHGDG